MASNFIKIYQGLWVIALHLFLIGAGIGFLVWLPYTFPGWVTLLLAAIMTRGYFFVKPNSVKVLLLFGKAKTVAAKPGFYWAHPFVQRKTVGTLEEHTQVGPILVHDRDGLLLKATASMAWKVSSAIDYLHTVKKPEAYTVFKLDNTLRKVLQHYPYHPERQHMEKACISRSLPALSQLLMKTISKELAQAGISVTSAAIGDIEPKGSNSAKSKYQPWTDENLEALVKDAQRMAALVQKRKNWPEGAIPPEATQVTSWVEVLLRARQS